MTCSDHDTDCSISLLSSNGCQQTDSVDHMIQAQISVGTQISKEGSVVEGGQILRFHAKL